MNTPSAALSRRSRMFFLLASMVVVLQPVPAQAQGQSRGELLYTTHCIACHSEQMHWRDKKLATDWNTLKGQVARWQGVAMLRWSDEDITGVTQYLNRRYYQFPPSANQVSLRTP